MSKKSIYALLIAVNDYPNVRPLSGCLNDMHAFHDYLSRQCNGDEFAFKPKILENDAATREAVIAGFQHFTAATEGDVCVLYFSGHGSRIDAPDFWEAQDGKIEAIVCYDACLADKELSCLIYETLKDHNESVHFLAVMDCCHSGSNTRADDGIQIRLSQPNRFPKAIQEYYGYEKGFYLPDGKEKYSAPKGRHVSFGACRNTQTAKETIIGAEFRGAFTSSLIEALDTSNEAFSYLDLEQRVGQKIENRVANQRPQLDAVNGANVQSAFLGGAVLPKNRFFVAWNSLEQKWMLNAGLYHGITIGNKAPSVIEGKTAKIPFIIQEIKADTAFGTWQSDNTMPVNKKEQYEVSVKIGGAATRLVAFSPDCDAARKEVLLSFFSKAKTSYITLTDDVQEASFFVHTHFVAEKMENEPEPIPENSLWLRKKGENLAVFYRMIADEITETMGIQFWRNVDNVMVWHHLKSLDNPATSLTDKNIQLTLYRSEGIDAWYKVLTDNMERIENWKTETVFSYKKDVTGKIVPPSFALYIENKNSQTLYFSALLMDGHFGIDNSYLPYCALEAGQNVWLSLTQGRITTKSLGLGIDDIVFGEGYAEENCYVKVMASTKMFDTNNFVQKPLLVTNQTMRGGLAIPEIEEDDWVCYLVPLRIRLNIDHRLG